jgi:hypothetical protein
MRSRNGGHVSHRCGRGLPTQPVTHLVTIFVYNTTNDIRLVLAQSLELIVRIRCQIDIRLARERVVHAAFLLVRVPPHQVANIFRSPLGPRPDVVMPLHDRIHPFLELTVKAREDDVEEWLGGKPVG